MALFKNRNWEVRGIRSSSVVRSRVVHASDHHSAVLTASKGRDFMLVRDCVLVDDLSKADTEKAAVRALGLMRNLG